LLTAKLQCQEQIDGIKDKSFEGKDHVSSTLSNHSGSFRLFRLLPVLGRDPQHLSSDEARILARAQASLPLLLQ
jgi:hypothetical protein